MAKHKKVENGQGAPAEEPVEKVDTSQIEADLGYIHATRAQAQAKQAAPRREEQARLQAILDSKRETVNKYLDKWTPYLPIVRQALALCELQEFLAPLPHIQDARNSILSAARQLERCIGGTPRQVAVIEGRIANWHNPSSGIDWEPPIMQLLNGLDGLEKNAQELKEQMEAGIARFRKFTEKGQLPKQPTPTERPADLEYEREQERRGHVERAKIEFDPFSQD